MKALAIYELLKAASDPNTSDLIKNKIQCILSKETSGFNGDYFEIEGREAGLTLVFDKLYTEVIMNKPSLLPQMLPIFIILCGDREPGVIISNIDWLFVNSL